MANENEVKAQVRLRFFSANKTRMNCVRSLQVTQKRGGGLTMKTLEGILQIDDGQQRNKVSGRAWTGTAKRFWGTETGLGP